MPSPPLEGCRNTDEGILVSTLPDWCRSSLTPVPYTIHAKQNNHEANTTATVRQTGMRSHVRASLITNCHGDEGGTGLGVKSNTVGSVCTPQTWSKTVRFEGRNAVRHNDIWWMNNANTIGRMTYIKNVNGYDTTPQSKQDWNVLPSDRRMTAFLFEPRVELGPLVRGPTATLPRPPLPFLPRVERPLAVTVLQIQTVPPPRRKSRRKIVASRLINRAIAGPMRRIMVSSTFRSGLAITPAHCLLLMRARQGLPFIRMR